MFGFEKSFTVAWILACYSMFAGILAIIVSVAEPQAAPLIPAFQSEQFSGAASLSDEPIPSRGILSIPVKIPSYAAGTVEVDIKTDGPLPDCVEILNSQQRLAFRSGNDLTSVWLKVNWRLVEEPVDFVLALGDDADNTESRRCAVTLHPLPVVSGALDGISFREGLDDAITATFKLAHPFPDAVTIEAKLLCHEDLVTSIPTRITSFDIPSGQTVAQVRFPVPDNSIASGDLPIRLTAESDSRRVLVQTDRSEYLYNDDERVYTVTMKTIGAGTINEDDENDRERTLSVVLNEPCGPKGLKIPLKVNAEATRGIDFELTSDVFEFQPGETECSLKLIVNDDQLREGKEQLTISAMPNEFTRFTGSSTSQFQITDSDPLQVDANISGNPVTLREGARDQQITVQLEVVKGQVPIDNWTDQQRIVKLRFNPLKGDAGLENILEVVDEKGVKYPNEMFSLGPSGKTTVYLQARDDKEYRGLLIGAVACESQKYVSIQQRNEWIAYVQDNEPFPAELRIEGKEIPPNDGLGSPYVGKVHVTEADPSMTANLVLELETPAERDFLVAMKISGTVDSQDVSIGPSKYLANENFDLSGLETVAVPKGEQTVKIPIRARDDDFFEGPERLVFELYPAENGKKALLYIRDNDPLVTGFQQETVIISEGGTEKIIVGQLDAPNGINSDIPISLSVSTASENPQRLQLSTLETEIKANERTVEVLLSAIPDSIRQGREAFEIRVETPQHRTSSYKAGPPLTVYVDDSSFELKQIVALVVTPSLLKDWDFLQESLLSKFASENFARLEAGILLVGDNGQTELWKVNQPKPKISPVSNNDADSVIDSLFKQLERQLPSDRRIQVEAFVFWDVTDELDQLSVRSKIFPDVDQIKVSMLFYGLEKGHAAVETLAKAADAKSRGSQKHRVTTHPNSSLLPVHLDTILK